MKANTYGGKFGFGIELKPEDMKEVNLLIGTVMNIKRQPPAINLSFDGDTPVLYFYFEKVDISVQRSSIKSGRR